MLQRNESKQNPGNFEWTCQAESPMDETLRRIG